MIFKKATISMLNDVLACYEKRIRWFKAHNINQWNGFLKNYNTKDDFVLSIRRKSLYVVLVEKQIVGAVDILNKDETYWKDGEVALYLKKLVSDSDFNKVGAFIFSEVKKMAEERNVKKIRLDCIASNEKLNDIYQNYGFKRQPLDKENNNLPYDCNLWELTI